MCCNCDSPYIVIHACKYTLTFELSLNTYINISLFNIKQSLINMSIQIYTYSHFVTHIVHLCMLHANTIHTFVHQCTLSVLANYPHNTKLPTLFKNKNYVAMLLLTLYNKHLITDYMFNSLCLVLISVFHVLSALLVYINLLKHK